MKYTVKLLLSVLFTLITISCSIAINQLPVGDWVTGPILNTIVFPFIITTQIILSVIVYKRANNVAFYSQLSISVISVLILIHYLNTHTVLWN